MIKKITFVLFTLVCISIYSQEVNLDKYKYIVVAKKFDFLKKDDQYQTSSLTKFLLRKTGFEVYLNSDTYPEEINKERCATLFARVADESSMFTTKCKIMLEDCYGKLIYESEAGKSKIKDYKKAYQEAIRNAFRTMEDFKYSYNATTSSDKKNEGLESKIASETITASETLKEEIPKLLSKPQKPLQVLYAQAITDGFQLVNTAPEVVYKVLKTNVSNVYIINSKKGIFYKVGEKWIAEYYKNNQLKQEVYEVKF